ncbi:hypothetical protein [Haloplanus halobius]|nr:hypothetical protein [Haloplanus sp. XH21]
MRRSEGTNALGPDWNADELAARQRPINGFMMVAVFGSGPDET